MAESMQTMPQPDLDDFAQTRADDLFESEIVPAAAPPEAPREPRALRHSNNNHNHHNVAGPSRGNSNNKPQKAAGTAATTTAETPAAAPPHAAPCADRLLSGGIRKPKLTDEELAARMERAKLNNARLTERARKANEDESSFAVLEAQRKKEDNVFRQKKVEAEKNQRELAEERERNRQRKLKAVQGREWDSDKKEEDYNPRAYNPRFSRGMHGGVAPRHRPQKLGNIETKPAPKKPEDCDSQWPDFPGPKKKDGEKERDMPLASPVGTWAEQVEATTKE